MNSKRLISQVKKQYPQLAARLTVKEAGEILINVSEEEMLQGTRLVEEHAGEWKEMALAIKEQLGFKNKIRDSGMLAAGFCHGAIFFINDAESIIVTINVIFKTIGLYFDHYKTNDRHMPFPGARTATISYWPYSKLQAEYAVDITYMLLEHFPGFVVFNNLHASMHISESLIFDYEEKELDLFQVLFSTNIHGAL